MSSHHIFKFRPEKGAAPILKILLPNSFQTQTQPKQCFKVFCECMCVCVCESVCVCVSVYEWVSDGAWACVYVGGKSFW